MCSTYACALLLLGLKRKSIFLHVLTWKSPSKNSNQNFTKPKFKTDCNAYWMKDLHKSFPILVHLSHFYIWECLKFRNLFRVITFFVNHCVIFNFIFPKLCSLPFPCPRNKSFLCLQGYRTFLTFSCMITISLPVWSRQVNSIMS